MLVASILHSRTTMMLFALVLCFALLLNETGATSSPRHAPTLFDRSVPKSLFFELEELSRLVAISYCVGNTGIQEPFECLNHCSDFKGFALVTVHILSSNQHHITSANSVQTWDTGLLDSSSSGYIVLSHPPWPQRILVVFRGTHSFSDAIHDLMTSPAEYLPYPADDTHPCSNCTVHSGFMASWNATKEQILPTLERLKVEYPAYKLVLAGHSLGGAVAGLAALEFRARDWDVEVTTFGEPRLGNEAMARYMDSVFPWNVSASKSTYHRVTRIHDPVPLLPFEDWGWQMHGGEIFISNDNVPLTAEDVERCEGDEDDRCIQGAASSSKTFLEQSHTPLRVQHDIPDWGLKIPDSWELWQLLFAHREYFWRLGLCFDPQWRDYPHDGDDLAKR